MVCSTSNKPNCKAGTSEITIDAEQYKCKLTETAAPLTTGPSLGLHARTHGKSLCAWRLRLRMENASPFGYLWISEILIDISYLAVRRRCSFIAVGRARASEINSPCGNIPVSYMACMKHLTWSVKTNSRSLKYLRHAPTGPFGVYSCASKYTVFGFAGSARASCSTATPEIATNIVREKSRFGRAYTVRRVGPNSDSCTVHG